MPPKSQPQARSQSASSKPAASNLSTIYLLAYNYVSAVLWFTILVRVAILAVRDGVESGRVYEETERFARLVQSGAALEVVHSLVGIVRAPLFTTAMQVTSRLLLVWGIGYNFPQTTRYSPAYTSMLVAWSVTEVIRYSYFAFMLGGTGVPQLLTWLRYNTFLVLYPLGVGSETWLIWKAIPAAEKLDQNYAYALYGVLATYIPGFYTLFTYMLKQRRRILGAKSK